MPLIAGQWPTTPKALWAHFYQITQIPRPSRQEAQIRQYICDLAEQKALSWQQDAVGNLVVYVPGKGSSQQADTLIIQNHLDMVTDHAPNKPFDFSSQALDLIVEKRWLTADRTTLGADNGIGCAAALALLDEPPENHPPLELLFTIDEETGLKGATELDASMLSGKRLLNLDTEEWGSVYIGCAGGQEWRIQRDYRLQPFNDAEETTLLRIRLAHLRGGHSGIDIHRQRSNAICLLSTLIIECADPVSFNKPLTLASFQGGQAHNIIPRDAEITLAISTNNVEYFEQALKDCFVKAKANLVAEDQAATLHIETLARIDYPTQTLTPKASHQFLQTMTALPHGIVSWMILDGDNAEDSLVSCSCNLAQIQLQEGTLQGLMSFRFMQEADKALLQKLFAQIREQGFIMEKLGAYPHWPNRAGGSKQLQRFKHVYQDLYAEAVRVKTIHAGLECGLICEKLPGLDAISFGPTIENAHSPSERVDIQSVEQFWTLLKTFLNSE